jgi:hypothetical protein
MTVHQVGTDSVALTLGCDELGQSWEHFGPDEARRWVLNAFAELGLPTQTKLQIEAFAGSGGIMLLAKAVWPRHYYLFNSFEDVLDCASVLHTTTIQNDLYCYEGQYILVTGGALTAACEYADAWPEEAAIRMEEYGKLLARGNALKLLAEAFKPR